MRTLSNQHIATVLQKFADSWKAIDGLAAAACFEPTADITIIGTDPGEYFHGISSYRESWKDASHHLAATRFDWTDELVIVVEGRVGWAHGVVEYDLVIDGATREYGLMWITAVVRETETGEWLIAHMHASAPDSQNVETL